MKRILKAIAAIMLILAVFFATGCHKDPKVYYINVSADPEVGGVVTGSGDYEEGQSCTVTATANDGYLFVKWMDDDLVVSTDAVYTFSVNANRHYIAIFAPSYVVNATSIPANGGTVVGSGAYQEGEKCTLIATANYGFTFTYWTENGEVVSALPTDTIMVTRDMLLVANFAIPCASSYIDLGLPSGTLWATWNVGAASPEGFGDYFAWGETQPKDYYDWNTYQYSNGGTGGHPNLTKYCNEASYGYNGFTDNLTTLLPEDDAATANWGEDWRMPTREEWLELLWHTTDTWTTQNGVQGRLFTAANGASLFLPFASFHMWSTFLQLNSCNYWSSSLNLIDDSGPDVACSLEVNTNTFEVFYHGVNRRDAGLTVRAVRSSP